MSDMTALRFAGVKTSAIGAFAVVGGDLETARGFVVLVPVHPVVEARPLGVAGVEFFGGEFAGVRPAPRLGGKAFQHARPAAPGVFVAIGMQAGEGIGDGAPCADEGTLANLAKPGRSDPMTSLDESVSVVGKALRKAREARNLTVETVAAESGVSAAKLAAYEAGAAEATLLEVCALAKAMGTTASDVFKEAGI
jgi:DNA-binding XRE family transcriptional regulator